MRVEAIASHVGVGIATLRRLFQLPNGCTISLRRLDAAWEVLKDGGTVRAAATFAGGYSSAENFSTAFKRRFGVTPSCVRAGEFAAVSA